MSSYASSVVTVTIPAVIRVASISIADRSSIDAVAIPALPNVKSLPIPLMNVRSSIVAALKSPVSDSIDPV